MIRSNKVFLAPALVFFLALFVASFMPSAAQASEPQLVSTHGDWSVYKFTENGNQVCYMAATPQKDEGNYSRRGKIYALVTSRPAEGTTNVFSYIAGYPYKEGSEVTVKVAGKSFSLFTQDETAWTADAETDNRLAQAIRKGSKMIVKGVSRRGTLTKDTYSLRGSGAAHDVISQKCGK